jgi:putative metallohydrolase (TIGR04338 family)
MENSQKDQPQKGDRSPLGLTLLRSLRLGIPRSGLVAPSTNPSQRNDVAVGEIDSGSTKAPQPRDAQRVRVYRAETPLKGRQFQSIGQCEEFCESVVGTLWWLNRFPELGLEKIPHLRDGRGARQAFYREDPGHPTITLPKRYRTANVILHELAHWTMHADDDLPNHGYTFTRVFMDLTAEFSGPAARELLASAYAEHRVNVGAEAKLGPDGIYRYGNDERLRLGRNKRITVEYLDSEQSASGVLTRSTKKQISLLLEDATEMVIPISSIWKVQSS